MASRSGSIVVGVALLLAALPAPAVAARPTCNGQTATKVGTKKADTIRGTSGNDVLVGLGGNDTIIGGGGNDLICGNGGKDVLKGGGGDDIIFGEGGADRIVAGGGNDLLIGGPGGDSLNGGKGSIDIAVYLFASGPISANLETGRVTGEGTDKVEAVEAVTGGPFNDTLVGSPGDDLFSPVGGSDIVDGNGGYDGVLFGFATGPLNIDLAEGTASGEGNDTLIGISGVLAGDFDDVITGGDEDTLVIGGAGNDTINSGGGDDFILGEAGDDVIDAGAGDYDYIVFSGATEGISASFAAGTATGEGSDSFTGVEGIIGSAFNDVITGGPLADFMFGEGGNDQLSGGAGDDGMDGGDGTDSIDGGDGIDLCFAETVMNCEEQGVPEEPPLQAFFRRHF